MHSVPRSFLTPNNITQLSDDDHEFLARKGVYSLPKSKTCDALVFAYCHYLHPMMPVIEIDDFLSYHQRGKIQDYNLSLVWSIFTAAANVFSPNLDTIFCSIAKLIQNQSLFLWMMFKLRVMHAGKI